MRNTTIQIRTKDQDNEIKELIDYYKNVRIESTSYTKKLIAPDKNFLFINDQVNKATFMAHQKIKADIKKSGFIPFEPPGQINYFGFNRNHSFNQKELICIDITAAYPTELLNNNWITEKTYQYLLKNIKKVERLKCTGMLATSKIIEIIQDKQIIDIVPQDSPTSCIFFQISHNIGQVLSDIYYSYPNYSYFYWVDGIFIKPELKNLVCELFEERGFKFTVEGVQNLKDKGNYLTYEKEGKKKILFMPKDRKRISQSVWEFIDQTETYERIKPDFYPTYKITNANEIQLIEDFIN